MLRSLSRQQFRPMTAIIDGAQMPWAGDRLIARIAAGADPASVTIDGVWQDVRRPLRFPIDFPEPLRARLHPGPIAALMIPEGRSTTLIGGLTLSDRPRNEFVDCTISFGVSIDSVELDGSRLTMRLVGPEWNTLDGDVKDAILRRIRATFNQLAGLLPRRPCGEIQLRLGSERDVLGVRSASSMYVSPAWAARSDESKRGEDLIAYQLARLWWGGCTRLVGPRSWSLEESIRWALCARITSQSASLSTHPPAVQRLSHSIASWLHSDVGITGIRKVTDDLMGMEVHETWLRARLAALGLRL